MSDKDDVIIRPISEQLSELHIFVVPPTLWQQHLNSAINQVIDDTVSAGFVRVHPEINVYSLREEIEAQLGFDTVPSDYYFLKCVGRCFTRVKPKQEYQIKVKNFLPPFAYSPEIYVLESTAEIRALFPPSGTSSERSSSSSNRNSVTTRNRSADFNPHKPIPPIRNGHVSHASTQSMREMGSQTELPRSPLRNTVRSTVSDTTPTPRRDLKPPATPTDRPTSHRNSSRPTSHMHTLVPPIDIHSPAPTGSATPLPNDNNHHQQPPVSPRVPSSEDPPQRLVISRVNDTDTDTGYLPPLSATPPTSPGTARRRPAPDHGAKTPQTFREDEETAAKLLQLEELKREAAELDKLTEEIKQKKHLDEEVERKKRELEEIERAKHLEINEGLAKGEDERRQAEHDRVKAEMERQYAEKKRTDDDERRRSEFHEYKKELENDLLKRQREETQRQRDQLKLEQEQLEKKRIAEEERLKREREEDADKKRKELEEQINELNRKKTMEEEKQRWEDENERLKKQQAEDEAKRRALEDTTDKPPPSPDRAATPKKAPLIYDEKGAEVADEETTPGDVVQSKPNTPTETKEEEDRIQTPDKESLLEQLEQARGERREAELRREDLVKRVKQLQNKAQNKRNQARDVWKKKYFEEKKKTPPLEEQSGKLRQEMENLHRKIMSNLEGVRDTHRNEPNKPGPKSNLRLQAAKLQHEIDSFKRRLESIKMKLTAEMKLRNQAETELRALRAELTQKKINLSLSRSQQLQVYGGGSQDGLSARTPIPSYN